MTGATYMKAKKFSTMSFEIYHEDEREPVMFIMSFDRAVSKITNYYDGCKIIDATHALIIPSHRALVKAVAKLTHLRVMDIWNAVERARNLKALRDELRALSKTKTN